MEVLTYTTLIITLKCTKYKSRTFFPLQIAVIHLIIAFPNIATAPGIHYAMKYSFVFAAIFAATTTLALPLEQAREIWEREVEKRAATSLYQGFTAKGKEYFGEIISKTSRDIALIKTRYLH